jgi:hypothetical protein
MNIKIGKGITLDLDPTQLPENSLNHVVYIGLRNILMDSHAGVTSKSVANGSDEMSDADQAKLVIEKSREAAERKWAAMLAGDIRVLNERQPRVTDPVEELANTIARREVVNAIRAAGRKAKEFDTAWFAKAIATFRQEDPSFEHEARRIITQRSKNAKVIDLDKLGLGSTVEPTVETPIEG